MYTAMHVINHRTAKAVIYTCSKLAASKANTTIYASFATFAPLR